MAVDYDRLVQTAQRTYMRAHACYNGCVDTYLALFETIGALSRKRYQLAEKGFAVLGLNHTEARLLTLLDRAGGEVGQDVLSGQLHVDRSNAGRGLRGLEEMGFVARRKDEGDKRANFVRIKGKGRKAVEEIKRLRKKMARELFEGLSADDAATALRLLEKVSA